MSTLDAAPLLRTVLANLQREPENDKFKRINLGGLRLAASAEALATLRSVGFEETTVEGAPYLVVTAVDAAALARAVAPAPAAPPAPAPVLSSRQEQRLAVERRDKVFKDNAKRLREETKAQIARDNYARKHDENWKTTQGIQKGGKDIDTFRGKFGEEKGG